MVPSEISRLVAHFLSNPGHYKSQNYKEAHLRAEFLDPLWEALGWDVHNRKQLQAGLQEVLPEDSLKVGGTTKAPDYVFRLGGERKFFAEAKRPSVNLKDDVSAAYQLRRYAWTAKLPLGVLTDFDEFCVYDCRVEPKKDDKASVARVLYVTCTEYAAQWQKIAEWFSYEAVLGGSIERFAREKKAPRGSMQVDEAFLRTLEQWRERIARSFAARNAGLSSRELNEAVQQTIDRIVFLRIAEDRGIESYGRLLGAKSSKNVYGKLLSLFEQADKKYNSGLFHLFEEPGRDEPPDTLTPNLKIDDQVLSDVLGALYYPDGPYEFSVFPADVLGQVYERFLGKTISIGERGEVEVDDKPEVRKAGGVYYTPTYVVRYVVERALAKYLESATPESVSRLTVLDPACGSGSFLLGAYDVLLEWHLEWYRKHLIPLLEAGKAPSSAAVRNILPLEYRGPEAEAKSKKKRKTSAVLPVYRGPRGEWRLATAEKRRILLNNVYGVDIDAQAVEVTKLSLLLRVLEGESEQTLGMQLSLFQERALPDLGKNIQCGNSLVGPEFYATEEALELSDDERLRVNCFDWRQAFPETMKAGGFDVIIGNPPYGAYLHEPEKRYLLEKYKAQSYQLDTYLLFLERALADLSHEGTMIGLIIPNPWLTNLLQTETRKLVFSSTRVHEIVHFSFPVFAKAIVDTEVVVLEKNDPTGWTARVRVVGAPEALPAEAPRAENKIIPHAQDKWRKRNGDVVNIFLGRQEEDLAEKILSGTRPLEEFFVINVGIKPYQTGKGTPPQTRETVENRPFDADRQVSSAYRPCLRGADITRFRIEPVEPRYLKYGPWLAEPRPAADFDAPLKILMRQTGDSLIAALDEQQYLCMNNMHVLVPKVGVDAYAFLGLINSKLMNWYYQTLNPEVGEALAEVKKSNVARLPMRDPRTASEGERKTLSEMGRLSKALIEQCRKETKAKSDADRNNLRQQISALMQALDRAAYHLYGLNEGEVALIEQQMNLE